MFQEAKPGLEHVVGPINQSDTSAYSRRKSNGVTPQETAVTYSPFYLGAQAESSLEVEVG